MKKRISLLICMLLTFLCLTGCVSEEAQVEYDAANMEQVAEFLVSYCSTADEATIEQWKNTSDFDMQYQLMQAGLPFTPESFDGALDSWQAGVEECGAYIGHGDYTYEVSNDELRMTTNAQFAEREATLTFIFDEQLVLESMTVDAHYTMGEILEKAALNTVLGMGTVFIVLIFISALISLFRFIPMLEKAWKKPKKEETESTEAEPLIEESAEDIEADRTDDTELIAVIAAAIAASEGTTTDGFVVRSIRRRPANKWKA